MEVAFRKKCPNGFSMVELMVAMAIIGLLIAIAAPNFINYRNHAYCSSVESDAQNIRAAIADYFSAPYRIEVPNLEDLKGLKTKNKIDIGGTIELIEIVITDVSERCPKGSTFHVSVYHDEKTFGWWE